MTLLCCPGVAEKTEKEGIEPPCLRRLGLSRVVNHGRMDQFGARQRCDALQSLVDPGSRILFLEFDVHD